MYRCKCVYSVHRSPTLVLHEERGLYGQLWDYGILQAESINQSSMYVYIKYIQLTATNRIFCVLYCQNKVCIKEIKKKLYY